MTSWIGKSLTELNPKWIGSGGEGISDKDGNPVPFKQESALEFDCPCGCGARILITVLEGFGGSHWTKTGNDFNDITLKPSIQRTTGCKLHFFVTDGKITQ